jgi:sarcosine oxidase delta subunit
MEVIFTCPTCGQEHHYELPNKGKRAVPKVVPVSCFVCETISDVEVTLKGGDDSESPASSVT